MANKVSGLKTPAAQTGSSTPSVTGLRRQIAGHKGQLKKLLVGTPTIFPDSYSTWLISMIVTA